MIKKITLASCLAFCLAIFSNKKVCAQNSLLVNFGTSSCSGSGVPAFSFIKNPLSASPSPLITCDLANQLPDIFAVFIAYNPKNNKVYVADIRSGIDTKIWTLDMGLPANISCPAVINTVPDYAYSYVSNNFEFDNNGDLWSFSNYDLTAGQCSMDKFDVNTGAVINTRLLQFPANNFPTAITSGDLTILPNGRMFATLGSNPSRLYEIANYSSTTTNATATFLTVLPQNCYGIAYLNGQLELTGSDFNGGCYYYVYDISSNTLSNAASFQNGQLPIDNTSITPSLGVTKQLLAATKVNPNTADLTYEVYVKNLGNVSLNNLNVTDDLAGVFGAANISNVSLDFAPGGNTPGLILNPSYNGNTNKTFLVAGQSISNQVATNSDYSVKFRLGVRVTNLNSSQTYLSSSVGIGTIGSVGTSGFINVADSSNNGAQTAVDPNNNGNAGEPGENIPTPFDFATLPVKFISINASLINKKSSIVKWTIATPTVNSDKFFIQSSQDAQNWNDVGKIDITNTNQAGYEFVHQNLPGGNLYYRIKEVDIDGQFIYSNIAVIHNESRQNVFLVYPNPADEKVTIYTSSAGNSDATLTLFDVTGRQIMLKKIAGNITDLNTANLPASSYVLKIQDGSNITIQKILVKHK